MGNCLKDYAELQALLNGANKSPGIASSHWAMDIDTRVRHLDPLQLPRMTDSDNSVKTLAGILDSRYGGIKKSLPFLAPFYEKKDLSVEIDRGFYQKPFIGAAVMAVFAESVATGATSSPGQPSPARQATARARHEWRATIEGLRDQGCELG